MMTTENSKITRRDFIKLTAAAGIMTGCGVNLAQAADPANMIKKYPDAPKSKVIHTRHAGVWKNDELEPKMIREILDASICQLTGVKDADTAWKALFKPSERIGIKVNVFSNSVIWTHAPLVTAVTESLVDAGIAAEQITIFDSLSVFEDAGYTLNQDGPGVRCIKEVNFGGEYKVADRSVELSNTLQNCDALINMPVLKSHMLAGLTFALKNHFGSVSRPSSLHYPMDQAISELNSLPPIKERTRLIIGDILEANLNFGASWPYWKPDHKGDSILMSFDPVAHDVVGLQILEKLKDEKESATPTRLRDIAHSYLEKSAQLGLGTHQIDKIDLKEINLS